MARGLALLLLAAAALKFHGLAVEPVGRLGWFSLPAIQFLTIELEIGLALWLLSNRNPVGAWAAAVVVFLCFAGFSAWQGWVGRSPCGCFDKLSASPWVAFGIDLVVLTLLLLGRPQREKGASRTTILKQLLPAASVLGGAAALLAVLAGLSTLAYGSPDAALAHLRGERISLYPRLVDLGTGAPGERREQVVEVVNRTDQTVRLIGAAPD